MNIEKICRCCLTNEEPLFSIYDGGELNNRKKCLAYMIKEITTVQPELDDKLPDKACISCISDINRCYTFKIKCEESNRTLKQLFCHNVQVNLENSENISKCLDGTTLSDDIIDPSSICNVKIESEMLSENFTNTATSNAENFSDAENSFIPNVNSAKNSTTGEITMLKKEIVKDEYNDSDRASNCNVSDGHQDVYDTNSLTKTHHNEMIKSAEKSIDQIDNSVEFRFENVSSPQWVTEEDSLLYLVNEEINIENVRQFKENKSPQSSDEFLGFEDRSVGSPKKLDSREDDITKKHGFTNEWDTNGKSYSCIYCDSVFSDYKTLRKHVLEHTANDDTSKCNLCHKYYSTTALKSHLCTPDQPKASYKRVSVRKEDGSYACEHCPKRFNRIGILINHRRIHTGEKPFKCKYCDKSFVQAGTRFNHEKIHTGEKSFKCRFCGKGFIQSGSCIVHERIHTGEKPYKCKFCELGFKQISTRKRHELSYHKE